MTAPDIGIYYDIPPVDYFAWPCESNSHLKAMATSPKHYRDQLPIDTAATRLGTLAHAVMLEPVELMDRYAVLPDYESDMADRYKRPKQTNEYRELVEAFTSANDGKEIVIAEEWQTIKAMHAAVQENAIASDWLQGPGRCEVCVVWDDAETGIRCKGRFDKMRQSELLVIDYKTTQDAGGFERQMHRFGYHRQAAMYLDGIAAVLGERWKFGIVCQEKAVPYCCRAALVAESTIEQGRLEYLADLQRVAECRRTNEWPGYPNPDEWNLPDWAYSEAAVAVDLTGLPEPPEAVPGKPYAGEIAF